VVPWGSTSDLHCNLSQGSPRRAASLNTAKSRAAAQPGVRRRTTQSLSSAILPSFPIHLSPLVLRLLRGRSTGSLGHTTNGSAMISRILKMFQRNPNRPHVPKLSEFPLGTRFVILEFDVPLACIPEGERCNWVNWYGGCPRAYDVTRLKVDNNWPADSFEEWTSLIRDSINRR
jgi:hypothetical protein